MNKINTFNENLTYNQYNTHTTKPYKDIGFIGIGQAGNNIVHLFEQLNYQCLFINSSHKDLLPLSTRYSYITPNTDGCNHDRNKAKKILHKYYKEILSQVQDKLYQQSIIFVVFSAGGGTGSGFSPFLIELLLQTFPEKHIGAITILPSDNESTQIQYNAYESYKELTNINDISCVFTLDNNTMNKYLLNSTFATQFNELLFVPEHVSYQSNIDTAELYKMLSQRGNAIIINLPQTKTLVPDLIKSLQKPILYSSIAPDKKIVYLALSLVEYPTEKQLQDLLLYTGKPLDIFININKKQNIAFLTGLTFPTHRIEYLIANIKKEKDNVISARDNALTNKISIEFNLFNDTKQKNRDDGIQYDFDAIFEKFL